MMGSADLYDQDFDAWIADQVRLLRQGRTQELDLAHLIVELEDMGKSNLRELESRLIVLVAHLLKWHYQLASLSALWKEFEGTSWRRSIIEQRTQIDFLLKQVPSLKASLDLALTHAWPEARRLTIRETGLTPERFPADCPYTAAQVLDQDFYPSPSAGSD